MERYLFHKMSKPRKASTRQDLVSGTTAGIITTICLHPLDLIKTRFQVHEGNIGRGHRTAKYRSTWHGIRTVAYNEGIGALYQGITPAVVGSGGAWGLYFSCMSRIRTTTSLYLMAASSTTTKLLNLCSSTEAGVTTVFLTNPIWLVKTRMQVQDKTAFSINGKRHLVRLFIEACLMPSRQSSKRRPICTIPRIDSCAFLVSHGVIQFVAYEELKSLKTNDGEKKLGIWEPLWMGALSKTIASSSTYPWQTIKSRIQQRQKVDGKPYNGMIDCCTRIVKNEGVRGLYKGLAPNLIRIAPGAAITFFTYENVKDFLINNYYF